MFLADELKSRRLALGLTQAQASEMSGVPQGRISEYERGAVEPTLATLRALASVYGPIRIDGGPRDVGHYRRLFAGAATVGPQLVARALYAAEFGSAEPSVEALGDLCREVMAEHGDVLSGEDALALLPPID